MTTGLSAFLRLEKVGVMLHWCPGCARPHRLNVSSTDHPQGMKWFFNGSYTRPTFTPGVTLAEGDARCEYVLQDGWLAFGAGCTHALAGQTVPLPVYPFHH